jgi:hypothetical protein
MQFQSTNRRINMTSPSFVVRAIYADEHKPFAETVGTFPTEWQAQEALETFRDEEDAPNFMGCEILYL